ncbi:MAG TPA: SigB/SigF/SigG family RNA polymerase sigma factor [Micromonosporaceae bacterium]
MAGSGTVGSGTVEGLGDPSGHAAVASRGPRLAHALLVAMARLPKDHPDRARLRDRVIEMHLPFAAKLARRFRSRGEPVNDLIQVATIGLIKAVDRYDVDRNIEFTRFAAPTIVGEVKRHFRDKGWTIRVPRELQELRLKVVKAKGELAVSLGRSVTVAELAAHLNTSERRVLDAIYAGNAYRPASLHQPVPGEDSLLEIRDVLGGPDPELESAENRVSLRPLITRLPDRERRIVALRFFADMTQAQIAAEVGISQMHVSRLLSRSLRQLRAGLAGATWNAG